MEIAVQWVRTSWSKLSRGGPMAARRNSVPVAFSLPASTLPVLHEVRATEASDFEPSAEVSHTVPERHDLLLDERDGALRVFLVVDPWGMPKRWRRPPAVRLAPGEWVRWQINYRYVHSSSGAWWYRAETVNLAYGQVDVDVFLGEPTRAVDERGHLR